MCATDEHSVDVENRSPERRHASSFLVVDAALFGRNGGGQLEHLPVSGA